MSLYEDQRAVVLLCPRCRKEVPRDARICPACSGRISPASVPCGYCDGNGACPACVKFGTPGRCRFCNDWDAAARPSCANCKGAATCHACRGSGKDTFCSGTGKVVLKAP